MCEAINEVTSGYQGLKFNHIGMVFYEEDQPYVIEATWPEVCATPLEEFLAKTPNTMYWGRVKPEFAHLIPKAVAFALRQKGVAYDSEFIYDNDKYYCSELLYDAFMEAYGQPFFIMYPMTYKSPDTDTFFPVWVDYYEQLGRPIPEGLPGCNPAGLSLSDKINILGAINLSKHFE